MAFRIYYTDGTVWSGPASEAPTEHVQIVAEVRDGRKYVHSGGDYFIFSEGAWRSTTAPPNGEKVALEGELIDTDAFKQIKKEAFQWVLQQ
jgi:hypothetical protein